MKKKNSWLVFLVLGPILFLPARSLTTYLMLRATPSRELCFSAGFDDIPKMTQALHYGADVNARIGYAGRTPLMVAAIHGKTEATRFLLEHGADPNLSDQKGLTALSLAISQHNPDVAQLLLVAGAKP